MTTKINRKAIFLFFSAVFIYSKMYSQDYLKFYDKVNGATYEYIVKKNSKEAIILLNEASKIWDLREGESELLAKCLLEIGDTAEAVKRIKLSVSKFNTSIERIRNIYKGLNNSPHLKSIEASYAGLQKEYYNSVDINLLVEIEKMFVQDQFIRNHESAFKEDEYYKLYRQIDSINILKVKEIYKKAGYIPNSDMFVLIMHGVNDFPEMWEFFEPELMKGIKEGKFFPDSYALMFDRRRVVVEKKNTWYGEFSNDPFGDEISKIDEIENVDERRKSIGLCSLKIKAELSHLKLPENYKFK